MSKYVAMTRPPKAGDDWWDAVPSHDTITVHAEDDRPIKTGIVDAHGVPLYRIRDRIKVGFGR